MQSLLNSASGNARDCLQKQLGLLAERNSCQGPWISQANMSLSLNPLKFRMPQRATVSFRLATRSAPPIFNVARQRQAAGVGSVRVPRPESARSPRLRSADAAIHLRCESTFRLNASSTYCCASACHCYSYDALRPRTDARAAGAHTTARSWPHDEGNYKRRSQCSRPSTAAAES